MKLAAQKRKTKMSRLVRLDQGVFRKTVKLSFFAALAFASGSASN